ncbi:hypothetical protein ACPWZ9_06735 [Pasteurella multocida]
MTTTIITNSVRVSA